MGLRLETHNLVIAVVGLCFVAAGLYAYHYMGRFLDAAREARGVVVDVIYESPTMQKGRMHPVVRFRTAEGTEVEGRTEKHHNTERGARVQIVYDSRDPQRVEVGTLASARNQRIFFSGAAVLFGLALSIGAVVLGVHRNPGTRC